MLAQLKSYLGAPEHVKMQRGTCGVAAAEIMYLIILHFYEDPLKYNACIKRCIFVVEAVDK